MVTPRYLTMAVEDHVRDVLSAENQIVFRRRAVRLQPGGYHEFDAVSDNGRIVASVKTASGQSWGARHPSAKVTSCIAELYFLSLAKAHKKLLVLTSVEFHELFRNAMAGKVPHGVEIRHIPLPDEVAARVAAVQQSGTDETQPVLDADELRAVSGR